MGVCSLPLLPNLALAFMDRGCVSPRTVSIRVHVHCLRMTFVLFTGSHVPLHRGAEGGAAAEGRPRVPPGGHAGCG
jgi:hypothetical protein